MMAGLDNAANSERANPPACVRAMMSLDCEERTGPPSSPSPQKAATARQRRLRRITITLPADALQGKSLAIEGRAAVFPAGVMDYRTAMRGRASAGDAF